MNNKHYLLEDNDIGTIEVTLKSGVKNFNIRLKPFQRVRVSAPARATKKQVQSIITRKKQWILQKQDYNRRIEKSQTVFEENSIISTFQHQFKIEKQNTQNIRLVGESPDFTIAVPMHYDSNTPEFQQRIRSIINLALQYEANIYLPQRVQELADRFKFTYSRLTFRNNKTRWGSCSTRGSISLNIQLMRLPKSMIDYIILHELCHTRHPNHGPGFKKLLYTIMPEAPLIEKELKNYRTQIF